MSKDEKEEMVWIIQFERRKANTAHIPSPWNSVLHFKALPGTSHVLSQGHWHLILLTAVFCTIREDPIASLPELLTDRELKIQVSYNVWQLRWHKIASLCCAEIGFAALPTWSSFWFTLLVLMSPHPYFFPKQTSLLPFIIFHERFLLPRYPLCSNLKIRPSSLNIILKAEESSTITSLPVGLILLLMHPNGTSFSLFFLTFALIFSMSFECIIHFKSEVFFIQTILQMLLS